MIHYHGTPITPRAVLETLAGRNFCVSYARPDDVEACHRLGQSVMLDNGAFSAWRTERGERGRRAADGTDWLAWRNWAERWLDYPTTWAVLPDAIDAGAEANDRLLQQWMSVGIDTGQGVPVWHLDEPLDRLALIAERFGRVCFGSSGEYAVLGTDRWHRRIDDAFDVIADPDGRVPWVHMLRGMAYCDAYPFASADSTDIGRNHSRPQNTARAMADRWDARQPSPRWLPDGRQLDIEGAA